MGGAGMSDYISRDAVRLIESDSEAYADAWNASYEHGFCDGINAVLELPAADVVEVVRCKDCKYLNEDLAVGEWDGSCRYWNTHSVLYSWFCSQGERKDGAE